MIVSKSRRQRLDSNHNPVKMKKRERKDFWEWARILFEIFWACLMTLYYLILEFIDLVTKPSGKSLRGQHVLVTGGARGLGREICLVLAKEGCRVTAVDVEARGCEETADEAKRCGAIAADWRVCDITDKEAVAKLFKDVPPVDVLINNAGIVSSADILSVQESHIERMMNVNVMAHFWTIRAVLPGMIERGRGHIVAIASVAAFTAAANIAPYTATKYAVTGLMASLREELRLKNPQIKTTSIHPFFISPPTSSKEHWDKTSRIPDVTAVEVARKTVQGIKREKITVTVPAYLYFLFYIMHMLPSAAGEMWRDLFPAKINSLPPQKEPQTKVIF